MQYIGLCNSIPRIISAILILIFVKKPSDAWMVQFILFIGSFFALLMVFLFSSRDLIINIISHMMRLESNLRWESQYLLQELLQGFIRISMF